MNCLASIGDSITWRPSVPESYPVLIGANRNFSTVVNAGVDGNQAAAMLARFDNDVLAHRPGAVSIMAGTNDAYYENDLTQWENDVRAMVNRAIAAGAHVTLCTPPVARDARPLSDYAAVARTIAGDTGNCRLFDVYARFDTYSEGTKDSLYSDVVHLNATGCEWVANLADEAENLQAFTVLA